MSKHTSRRGIPGDAELYPRGSAEVGPPCDAITPSPKADWPWVCCRDAGHADDHAAYGTQAREPYVVWPNTEAKS